MGIRRRIWAIMMLAVILPALTVAPFHKHPERSGAKCEDCVNHRPHNGHLSGDASIDECLVCQFVAASYVPSEQCRAAAYMEDICAVDVLSITANTQSFNLLTSSRAPPVSFCL